MMTMWRCSSVGLEVLSRKRSMLKMKLDHFPEVYLVSNKNQANLAIRISKKNQRMRRKMRGVIIKIK
jgi:hypothetical protein